MSMIAVLGNSISLCGLCKDLTWSRDDGLRGRLKHHSDEDELREEILFYVRSEHFWQGVRDYAANIAAPPSAGTDDFVSYRLGQLLAEHRKRRRLPPLSRPGIAK
jgi:hypothetical protein